MQDILDILSSPDEYWPFLLFIGIFLAGCAALCVAALTAWQGSRSWGTQRPRLCLLLALVPTLLSLWGLFGNFQFYFEGQSYRGVIDLKWLLMGPALLGVGALWSWHRSRRSVSPGF